MNPIGDCGFILPKKEVMRLWASGITILRGLFLHTPLQIKY